MPNPDILYQPGAQGGATLTTNAPTPPQFSAPPTGFDMSWLQQLAERKAMQEASDRAEARRRMAMEDRMRQRMMSQQDTMMQRQRAEGSKPKGPGDDMEEVWRYQGGYMHGAEAPIGVQNAAFTGKYRKRATPSGGGGSPSVNPVAQDTSKWAGEMEKANAARGEYGLG